MGFDERYVDCRQNVGYHDRPEHVQGRGRNDNVAGSSFVNRVEPQSASYRHSSNAPVDDRRNTSRVDRLDAPLDGSRSDNFPDRAFVNHHDFVAASHSNSRYIPIDNRFIDTSNFRHGSAPVGSYNSNPSGHLFVRYAPQNLSSNVLGQRGSENDRLDSVPVDCRQNFITGNSTVSHSVFSANSLGNIIANQVMNQTAIANENQITNKIANIIATTLPTIVASVMSADSQVPSTNTSHTSSTHSTNTTPITSTNAAGGETKKKRKQKENEKRRMKRQERINCFRAFKQHWKSQKDSEMKDVPTEPDGQDLISMDVDKRPERNHSSLPKTSSSEKPNASNIKHKSSNTVLRSASTSLTTKESMSTKETNANFKLSSKISRATTKHAWEDKERNRTGWGSGANCQLPNPGADWADSFSHDKKSHSYGKWKPNINVDSNGMVVDNKSVQSMHSPSSISNANNQRSVSSNSSVCADDKKESNPSPILLSLPKYLAILLMKIKLMFHKEKLTLQS